MTKLTEDLRLESLEDLMALYRHPLAGEKLKISLVHAVAATEGPWPERANFLMGVAKSHLEPYLTQACRVLARHVIPEATIDETQPQAWQALVDFYSRAPQFSRVSSFKELYAFFRACQLRKDVIIDVTKARVLAGDYAGLWRARDTRALPHLYLQMSRFTGVRLYWPGWSKLPIGEDLPSTLIGRSDAHLELLGRLHRWMPRHQDQLIDPDQRAILLACGRTFSQGSEKDDWPVAHSALMLLAHFETQRAAARWYATEYES